MTRIVVAYGDDWQGIYVDGSLLDEGHSLELVPMLKLALGVFNAVPDDVSSRWVDLDWLDNQGSLPSNILDVKWETDD